MFKELIISLLLKYLTEDVPELLRRRINLSGQNPNIEAA
jgi:hypothetical protein